jgi:sensor domain CHASE-containing protein
MTDAGERKTARKSQAAVRRLLVLTFTLVAVVLVGVTALLTEGSRRLDELKVNEDRFLIANAVDRISTRIVSDMTTVTVWDQAYRNMRPGVDQAWADAEVGGFYANNRGFDLTVAIDEHDTPFYAWVGKHRADPARRLPAEGRAHGSLARRSRQGDHGLGRAALSDRRLDRRALE